MLLKPSENCIAKVTINKEISQATWTLTCTWQTLLYYFITEGTRSHQFLHSGGDLEEMGGWDISFINVRF